MRSQGIPDPDELRRRFGHSREELAQRAVASLVVGREPAAWNRPETPTTRGLAFLRALDPFGDVGDHDVEFVDEFELPARHDGEKAGWPDWAVVQDGRVVLVELKTERGSHTPGQRERYLDLGRHHHPDARVDLVYVTPPMALAPPAAIPERCRYEHLTWGRIGDLVAEIWADSPEAAEATLASFAAGYLRGLDQAAPPPPAAPVPEPPPHRPEVPADTVAAALDTARHVEADRRPRGVLVDVSDPDDLDEFRLQLRELLPGQAPHVGAWLWRAATSGGRALTALGAEDGYELRLSYYR